jgi:cold shock protein
MSDKQFGVVKFYAAAKHFGFIGPDDGGPDVYVHQTVLDNAGLTTLEKDQRVEFRAEEDRRGGKRLRVAWIAPVSGDSV